MRASLCLFCLLVALSQLQAQTNAVVKRSLTSWLGQAPKLDGVISPGEYADAVEFRGVNDWVPTFTAVTNAADLALRGWVKHDSNWLYFAFEVQDDTLYGIDTPRWLPPENPRAHELSRDGFPWFGDEMEILINAPNTWKSDEDSAGNGSSWQMVCNLTKSRLGGIGQGGLLEGEPRSDAKAWETYQRWILQGSQRAVARPLKGGKGYVIEWAIRFNPCMEIAPGTFYSVDQGELTVGLNLAVGDLDKPEIGAGNFGHFHHEQWFSGAPQTRTHKSNFGTLKLMGRARKPK